MLKYPCAQPSTSSPSVEGTSNFRVRSAKNTLPLRLSSAYRADAPLTRNSTTMNHGYSRYCSASCQRQSVTDPTTPAVTTWLYIKMAWYKTTSSTVAQRMLSR